MFSCGTFYLILQWIKRIYYLEIHSLLNTVWFDFLENHDSQRPVAKTLVWWVSVVPRITCGATVTWLSSALLSILPRQISAAERYHQKEISKEKKLEKNRPPKKVHTHKNPRECSPNNSNLCRNCVNLCQARVYRCMLLGCSTIYYSWTLMNRARPHISKKRTETKERKLSKSKPDQMR